MAKRIDPSAANDAADFNATYKPGTPVDYWLIARDLHDVGEGRSARIEPSGRGITERRAQVRTDQDGDIAVVWIVGVRGPVALTHVRVVESAVTR